MTVLPVADLYCGAGGTSSGLVEAAEELGLEVRLVAINHWSVAIATHAENHPFADHYCAGVENVDPRKAVPGGYLKLLVASPECIYHSNARGGRPINDQLRATPWDILRWMEALYVENVLIENVPEFRQWGPLDEQGHRIQRQKGKTFLQYVKTIRSLGYFVDWRVLNAADYGDPTTRQRLFIMCRRKHRVRWPEPTHARNPQPDLHGHTLKRWVPAREIIDWSIPAESIYARKQPLKETTLRRIEAGLRKYSGLPFMLGQQSCSAPRDVDQPVPTVATAGAISLVQPFLLQFNGTNRVKLACSARSIDCPVPTITAAGEHVGLVQPFVLNVRGGKDGYMRGASIDEPLPTVTTINPLYLVQPFIVNMEHGRKEGKAFILPTNHGNDNRAYSIDEPMRTITTVDAWAMAQPFLVGIGGPQGAQAPRSVDEPLRTVVTSNHQALIQPFLVKYYGSGQGAASVDEPMPTVTAVDRFGLAQPRFFRIDDQLYMLDILFRMLVPEELARAQGFRPNFRFRGTRRDVVRQIGNAVPRRMARALCKVLLA